MASIFIVEDEISIAKMYEILLKISGHDVIAIARNGQEAVDAFRSFKKKPDIIIMDHRMPIKNGIEASQEILEIDGSAKIIFASADSSVRDFAKSIGVISFKVKPFDGDLLLRNIDKALGLKNEKMIDIDH